MARSAMQSAVGAFQQGYQFQQNIADNRLRREQLRDRQQWRQEKRRMERARFDAEMDQYERERKQTREQQAWAGIGHALSQGQTPSTQLLEQANEASGGKLMRAYRNVWSPGKRRAVDTLKQAVESGQPQDRKSLVNAANLVMQGELAEGVGETFTGDDGKEWTIERKFIQGVVPSPGGEGVMFDLAVEATDDEGNRKVYGAPATDGRSAGGDDNIVRDVPMDEVVKKVQGLDQLSQLIESNEQLRSNLEQLAVANGIDPQAFTSEAGELSYEEFKNGDQVETWMVGPGGQLIERVSTAPRWKPETDGKGSAGDDGGVDVSTSEYNNIKDTLETMFADTFEGGFSQIANQNTRDTYLQVQSEAERLYRDAKARGAPMTPTEAAKKAYRSEVGYEPPMETLDAIDQRVEQEWQAASEGSGVFGFGEEADGMSRKEWQDQRRQRYLQFYNEQGRLPESGELGARSARARGEGQSGSAMQAAAGGGRRDPSPQQGARGDGDEQRRRDRVNPTSTSAAYSSPDEVRASSVEAVRRFVENASAEKLDALPPAVRTAIAQRLTGGQ